MCNISDTYELVIDALAEHTIQELFLYFLENHTQMLIIDKISVSDMITYLNVHFTPQPESSSNIRSFSFSFKQK